MIIKDSSRGFACGRDHVADREKRRFSLGAHKRRHVASSAAPLCNFSSRWLVVGGCWLVGRPYQIFTQRPGAIYLSGNSEHHARISSFQLYTYFFIPTPLEDPACNKKLRHSNPRAAAFHLLLIASFLCLLFVMTLFFFFFQRNFWENYMHRL